MNLSSNSRVLFLLMCCAAASCAIRIEKLCGSNLSDMLELICRGRGFNWAFSKRSAESAIPVIVKRRSSDGAMGAHVGPGGGIVDECCYNECSLVALESYCAPGDSMISQQDYDPMSILHKTLSSKLPSNVESPPLASTRVSMHDISAFFPPDEQDEEPAELRRYADEGAGYFFVRPFSKARRS